MRDGSDTCVLLPIVSSASVDGLVAVAVDVAGPEGRLRAVTAVPPEATDRQVARARSLLHAVELAVAEDRATRDDDGPAVDTEVVEAEHPAVAVRQAAEREEIDAVVMGWLGSKSSSNSFGSIIDEVVGRSRVPLLVVRSGKRSPSSLVVAFDTDQLHPAGRRGLMLAGATAASIRRARGWPVTVVQAGSDDLVELPAEISTLTDRIHHDPRRRHEAVAALVEADSMVVAPVAPTVAGLRAATTRLNWAVGAGTLVVAIDVGPVGPRQTLSQIHLGGTSKRRHESVRGQRAVALTISRPEPVERRPLLAALALAGHVGAVRTWWSGADECPHLSVTVTVEGATTSEAVGSVVAVTDRLPELVGARLRYDLVDAPTPRRVRELRPLGPLGELDQD